jgi:Na+-translocating ferredoxin:NAD+ oxidoreductase RnfC subunit
MCTQGSFPLHRNVIGQVKRLATAVHESAKSGAVVIYFQEEKMRKLSLAQVCITQSHDVERLIDRIYDAACSIQ